MDKLSFLLAHYAALLLFVVSCWGIGQLALRSLLRRSAPMQRWLAYGLYLCTGVGIMICTLQLLGVAGLLTGPWLIALLVIGCMAAALQVLRASAPITYEPTPSTGSFLRLHWTVWLLLLLGLGLVLFPLRLPHAWDELMYHLPHAREWAKSGKLQINEWLRYPYFPYNYHLLYAGAMVLYDDVMPHLLHALAGWTTALLLYQLALRQSGRIAACAAAIAWLALVRDEFGNAQIDMALAMFLLAGWAGFILWWETVAPRPIDWLVLAAFLLGVAAGTKYQMLSFLPFFAVAVLLRERKPKMLLWVLAAGLLPCAYWYLRNAVLTGDPFDPLGGNIFGFHEWNQADLAYQMQVVSDVRDWPHWLLWPAVVAPLLPSTWRHPGLRVTLGFGAYAFVVWLVTSHYSRYLLPAYPVLLLLAAHVVVRCIAAIQAWLRKRSKTLADPGTLARGRLQGATAVVLVFLAMQTTSRSVTRDWANIAATPAERKASLRAQLGIAGETLDFLNRLPGASVYQFGMEYLLYYAPQPIYGDHFGRWRYPDFINLSPSKLAARLAASGLNTLAVSIQGSQHLLQHRDFSQCFDAIHKNSKFEVFKLKPSEGCSDPAPEIKKPATDSPFVIGPTLKTEP